MTIREKLIKIRSDSKLSQQEFADKLNISRQTVTRWEAGKSTPSSVQILNICREFNLDANELLTDGDPAPRQTLTQEQPKKKFDKRYIPFIATGLFIAAALAGLIVTIVYCAKDAAYDTSNTVWIISVPQNTPMLVLSLFLGVFIILLTALFIYLWRRGKK